MNGQEPLTLAYWQPVEDLDSQRLPSRQTLLDLSRLGRLFLLRSATDPLIADLGVPAILVPTGGTHHGFRLWRDAGLTDAKRALRRLVEEEPLDLLATGATGAALRLGVWAQRELGCKWVVFGGDPVRGKGPSQVVSVAPPVSRRGEEQRRRLLRQANLIVCMDRPEPLNPANEGMTGSGLGPRTPEMVANELAMGLGADLRAEAFSRLLLMPNRHQEENARWAILHSRIRQIVPRTDSPFRRPSPLQGHPRSVVQPCRIVWLQAASITESESATEVQRPLGLTRFHRVAVLAGRDTRIPPVIGENVELVRASAYRESRGLGRIRWIWCALPALHRLVRAGKCEMLLTPVDSISLLIGFLAKRWWGMVWVVNCWDHPYGRLAERRGTMVSCAMRLRGSWDGWLLRAADLTVLNILPGALRVLRVNPEKCYFAGNGVCARVLQQIGHTVASDSRCIGVLANVSRAKAPWFALAALVKVRERLPGVRLRLIGEVDESFRPELMARIEALGLADAVEITGWKPFREAMALAAACRTLLYCYPGSLRLRWNLVLKIGEYYALGRPVVAVDLPGSRALIRPGETGYLVPPDDPAAAADRLCQILSDEALWNRLRQGALQAAQIMDWERVCDDINQRIGALPDV